MAENKPKADRPALYQRRQSNNQATNDFTKKQLTRKFQSNTLDNYSEFTTIIYEREESITEELDDSGYIFEKKTTSSRVKITRFFLVLLLILSITVLATSLIYQLWHRQLLNIPISNTVQPLLNPINNHVERQLGQLFDIKLPTRRDLARLELLSARVEPHPDRATTVLLKVNLVNHSTISQPFPWLELALMDEDGRIISRRALPAEDYLYNNRLSNQLKAKQSQKVTIELLAFPQQAQGYEVRLLDK